MPGWHHNNANWKPVECPVCATTFTPRSGYHKFCSQGCKGKHKYLTGQVSTESQYRDISGNWDRYLSRLLYSAGRKRAQLSRAQLKGLLEKQNYLCAVSKQPLTCLLEKGTTHLTNASIDQIEPSGGYHLENIRLVCRIVNTMKWTMTDDELLKWCRTILNAKETSL